MSKVETPELNGILKVNYRVEALEQIHTGSDENTGTIRTLRRELRRNKDEIHHVSKFGSAAERREAIVTILHAIYKSIDNDLKASHYGFYDAYSSKVIAATKVDNKQKFLTVLCKSCGIRLISDKDSHKVIDLLDMFSDAEFLYTVREESQYLMLMMKDRVQSSKPDFKGVIEETISDPLIFQKKFIWIPFVAGNSIKGLMRRLIMTDYLKRIGIDKEKWGVEESLYNQLLTGGKITKSTAFEDIELREKYIYLCPAMGLLGSAIGNMTIRGCFSPKALRMVCKENGTADYSFWENIGKAFGTRLDSSKYEREFDIIHLLAPDDKAKKDQNTQMKYELEVFNTGTLFDSRFTLFTSDPVLRSVFWYMIKLFRDYGYIGGGANRGYGNIDVQVDIPQGAEDLYLAHIEKVKDSALEFFGMRREEPLDVLA